MSLYAEEIRKYTLQIKLNPNNFEAYINRANALIITQNDTQGLFKTITRRLNSIQIMQGLTTIAEYVIKHSATIHKLKMILRKQTNFAMNR